MALKNTLDDVTADEALWKPAGSDNSIWETVSHLNYYNFAYVERFKGVDYQYPADDNDATFTAGEATDCGGHEIRRDNEGVSRTHTKCRRYQI